jgi:hypothetical protein
MKLQVSGVTPCQKNGQRNGWTGAALLTAYEVDADAISAIEEGTVWEITDVSCRGRSSSGGGVFNSGAPGLELTVGRRSSWRRVSASALQRGNLAPSPVPRRLCTVRDLSEGHDDGKVKLGEEFDAVAVVVRISQHQIRPNVRPDYHDCLLIHITRKTDTFPFTIRFTYRRRYRNKSPRLSGCFLLTTRQ